jgi:hypothetical protein
MIFWAFATLAFADLAVGRSSLSLTSFGASGLRLRATIRTKPAIKHTANILLAKHIDAPSFRLYAPAILLSS